MISGFEYMLILWSTIINIVIHTFSNSKGKYMKYSYPYYIYNLT